ncbi:MAG: hypothetical protein ABL993_00895 [Vicinamibacterales bacterium]
MDPKDQVQETSLHDDLAAAFAEDSAQDSGAEGDQGTITPGVQSGGTGEVAPAVKPAEETPEQVLQRERDARGRFAPGTKKGEQISAAGQSTQAVNGTAQVAPAAQVAPVRAPGSWTPEARETFAALPPVAQKEIMRREREISDTLNHTAEARKFHEEVTRTLAPYEAMLRAEGSNSVAAIDSLMKTAAALRTGSPAYKAQLVAGMIRDFAIPIDVLDQAIVALQQGRGPAAAPQPGAGGNIEQIIQQQLAPIQQFMTQFQQTQQQTQQAQMQQAAQSLEEFAADPANEFIQDVGQDMADLLEMAAKRGQPLSLQDAYRRATLAHPSISQILENRRATQGAAQQTAAARRAKNAAASVSSVSAPLRGDEDDDDGKDNLRSDLMSAMRTVSAHR